MKFEIKKKDYLGRISKIKIGGKVMETPAFLPVLYPGGNPVSPKVMKRMGVEGVITNAYLIYQDDELREKALSDGIHNLLEFNGLVMTDSGAYQFMRFGDIGITNREIIEFQIEIGSDIGVILDYPITIDLNHKEALERLEFTKRSAVEGRKYLDKITLVYPIHGGYYKDILLESISFGRDLSYPFFGFGSIVPEAISYNFEMIAKGLMEIRKRIPWHPLHLFGLGHPMFFSLAVLLGADTFDSASYILFAKENRVLTSFGTKRLEDLDYLPTSHPYWMDYTPREILSMEHSERIRVLSEINLYECLLEVRRIKQAIRDGRLWEYTKARVNNNPFLLDAFRSVIRKRVIFNKRNPVSKKKAFFYQGWESFLRTEVQRHFERMRYYEFDFDTVLILPDVDARPYEDHPFYKKLLEMDKFLFRRRINILFLSSLFGLIPNDVKETYPLTQSIYPIHMERWVLKRVKNFVESFLDSLDKEIYFFLPRHIINKDGRPIRNFSRSLIEDLAFNKIETHTELMSFLRGFEIDEKFDNRRLWKSFLYQNGIKIPFEEFLDLRLEVSHTGRIRKAWKGDELFLVVRANDGMILPKLSFARKIKEILPYPKRRVVVSEDTIDYIKRFKDVLAPAVIRVDREIRPGEFVLVVDPEDRLIGVGEAALSGEEIEEARYGKVVNLRDVLSH